MAKKIVIDPITRIEGHLKIEVEVKDGKVTKSHSAGEMFRGWENILIGRNPVDAQHITQRICGVCPSSHAQASTMCLDSSFGIQPPDNGRLIRNLMLGANFIQSHILHFYHLAALDYVDITAIAAYKGNDRELKKIRNWVISGLKLAKAGEPVAIGPFLPRYEGDYYIKDANVNIELIHHYVLAFKARRKAHEMLALFGGRMPHEIGIAPGGATQKPTIDKIVSYKMRLLELIEFIEKIYVADVMALAKVFPEESKIGAGYGNYLAYGFLEDSNDGVKRWLPAGVIKNWKLGKFDPAKIAEHVGYSYFDSGSKLHPSKGETKAKPGKKGAYSWVKAPRYDNLPMEVGPAARMAVAYLKGHKAVKAEFDKALKELGLGLKALDSNAGRHLARALECKIVAEKLVDYVSAINPAKPFHTAFKIPDKATGMGLTEAPRGALGHWIEIKGGKIARYQAVVPTTWNASPRDDGKKQGPIEKCLMGTPVVDPANPIEPARVVRSFDPCLACAVHTVKAGKKIASVRVS